MYTAPKTTVSKRWCLEQSKLFSVCGRKCPRKIKSTHMGASAKVWLRNTASHELSLHRYAWICSRATELKWTFYHKLFEGIYGQITKSVLLRCTW